MDENCSSIDDKNGDIPISYGDVPVATNVNSSGNSSQGQNFTDGKKGTPSSKLLSTPI